MLRSSRGIYAHLKSLPTQHKLAGWPHLLPPPSCLDRCRARGLWGMVAVSMRLSVSLSLSASVCHGSLFYSLWRTSIAHLLLNPELPSRGARIDCRRRRLRERLREPPAVAAPPSFSSLVLPLVMHTRLRVGDNDSPNDGGAEALAVKVGATPASQVRAKKSTKQARTNQNREHRHAESYALRLG